MKLYKFRPLVNCCDYDRVLSIINDGFYCCDFLNFNDFNEGVFPIEKNSSHVSLDLKLKYKICSFSEKSALKCPLMWGHYANAGMGVAIEIKISDISEFEEVHYGNEIDNKYDGVKKILTNKSKAWKHERERRYLSITQEKFYEHPIEKIYFGMPYSHLINYEELITKHRKLRDYVKYSELLKTECEINNIQQCRYEF